MSNDAIDTAVTAAKEAYENTETNPLDHGFAHIEGIDGRTKLARKLEKHPKVETDNWDYVTIEGLNRYLTPQRNGYAAFIETLEKEGIDTDGMYQIGRLD